MSRPVRRKDLTVGDLNQETETVLFDERSGRVVSLNLTAAAIWYLCDGTRDVQDIAREVSFAFPNVSVAMVETDVQRILEQLTKQELVVE